MSNTSKLWSRNLKPGDLCRVEGISDKIGLIIKTDNGQSDRVTVILADGYMFRIGIYWLEAIDEQEGPC